MKPNGSHAGNVLILPDSVPQKKRLVIELEAGEWIFLEKYSTVVGVSPELFISRATQRLIGDKEFQAAAQKKISEAKA